MNPQLLAKVNGRPPKTWDEFNLLSGISPRVRSLISPVLLATLLERLSAHLEVRAIIR